MDVKPGYKVKVITKDMEHEGIFVNETDKVIFLKLDSGYNIGIKKQDAKIEILGKGKELKISHAKKISPKENLPVISVLHTGGTIASKVDYRTGAVYPSFNPEDLVAMYPELSEIANVRSKLISNMFSEDMRPGHYRVMAKAIEEEIKNGCEGIILTHGTDTLAYTAAALSFILGELPVPLIIVGAQRSSDRGSSDAAMNLICAAEFIVNSDFCEVAICMHDQSSDDDCAILPGCKTRKMHTSRRDAFKAINDTAIAKVNYKTRKIQFFKKDYKKKPKDQKFEIKADMEEKVGLLKSSPLLTPDQISVFKGYKGLVIEGTGLGQMPINELDDITKINAKNFEALKEVISYGCVVVMASQCLYGRVHMHVYSTAVDLEKIGVISAEDMLPETALMKLSWLLANYPKDEAVDMIGKNLCGEINSRLQLDEFD